jgi:uncharacterized protein (UPF0305 family)
MQGNGKKLSSSMKEQLFNKLYINQVNNEHYTSSNTTESSQEYPRMIYYGDKQYNTTICDLMTLTNIFWLCVILIIIYIIHLEYKKIHPNYNTYNM